MEDQKLNETQSAQIAIQDQQPHRQQQATQISSALVPNDYLCWSIFNTIFCNICFGVMAIVYSVKTRQSIQHHSLANAQQQSSAAFKLNMAAFLVGLLVIVLIILLNVFAKQ
jgi:hypothetical protein